jgi:uncharacterized protein with PIN domain
MQKKAENIGMEKGGKAALGFPLGEVRFVADITVGKAVKWLRILGMDTHFMRRLDDDFLAGCLDEGRIFLTRDSRLAVRPGMSNALLLTDDDPSAQVTDVLRRLGLVETVRKAVRRLEAESFGSIARAEWPNPMSRCVRCNEALVTVDRADVVLEVPDFTWATQDRFRRCPVCRRVYWGGTHRDRMIEAVKGLLH